MTPGTWLEWWAAAFWLLPDMCFFCETAPNDSIQGRFTNLSGFNPLKSGAGEIPFWWGGHKTRNVSIRRSENQRRDHMTSCENFVTVVPQTLDETPWPGAFSLNSLFVCPSTSHTHIQEDGVQPQPLSFHRIEEKSIWVVQCTIVLYKWGWNLKYYII